MGSESFTITDASGDIFANEFDQTLINDKRLRARAVKIYKALQDSCTSCIRRLLSNKKEARQAYDFFSNPKVKDNELIAPHYAQTLQRIKEHEDDYLILIQDATYINYSSHKAKLDVGRIGKVGKTEQYGIIQHTNLCVTSNNQPLGIVDLAFYDNEKFSEVAHRSKRPISEKRSSYWLQINQAARLRLGPLNKKLIRVSDRESDFFEYMHDLIKHDELFVIRCKHNRYTGEKHRKREGEIEELLAVSPVVGKLTFAIQNSQSKKVEEITLDIKKLDCITIPASDNMTGKNEYNPIKLNVVKACNQEKSWTLLTNLTIDTLEDIKKVIDIYKMRWHIEDYHKVLKTGYQIEDIGLHSSYQAIINFLTMIAVSACRLYWLIFVGRNETELRASRCFAEHEWRAIYAYFKMPQPEQEPAVQEVVLLIARLGGYKPSKHSLPPGTKTMWIAFQHFYHIAQMFLNLSTKT